MIKNPLTACDFYKVDHRRQYPEGTELVYSNLTPRNNKLSNLPDNKDKVVFFGLQFFIKDFLIDSWNTEFFNKPKEEVVAFYKRRLDTSLGTDAVPVEHIEALHDLGYLPIEIKALQEGVRSSVGVPVLTIKNTIPEFFWLVNYLETIMSAYLWKSIVSATTANWYKELFDSFALKTTGSTAFTPFQGHDFSFRGMSGYEDACLSGAGHLLSFVGTDTIPAIDFLEKYYKADATKELIGCSVPATEHSVMCLGSFYESEYQTFERLITKAYPKGIVSIVSDSFDYWKVITEFLPQLKDQIMAREGKVVIRPDSGDPVDIICGTGMDIHEIKAENEVEFLVYAESWLERKLGDETPHGEYGGDITENVIWNGKVYNLTYSPDWNRYDKQYYYIDNYGDKTPTINSVTDISPEIKGSIECLWEIFGGTINEKGYKELDPHIGLIYGDSITPQRAKEILEKLERKGFASTNVVFGIGSFTYQYVTRDTYSLAVKATAGIVNGKYYPICKDPKTGESKKSHKGFLKVVTDDFTGELRCIDSLAWSSEHIDDELYVVFKNGILLKEYTLSEIRQRLKNSQ